MIKSVELQNFLSFGPNSERIELRPLNIIIGRNGSGKSNFIDAIDLLRNAPTDIQYPILKEEGGNISDWLFKSPSETAASATMKFVVKNHYEKTNRNFPELLHQVSFAETGHRFTILDEKITTTTKKPGENEPYLFYDYSRGNPVLNVKNESGGYIVRKLTREEISPEQSILQQRSDPDSYPEITMLAKTLKRIRLYRHWSFGRGSSSWGIAKAGAANDFLAEDYSNLPLIVNTFERHNVKHALLERLQRFYPNVLDICILLEGGKAQLFFREKGLSSLVPSGRLSDGTGRYLCLLSILLHPTPPPLICIEEPELGLHPDILPTVGRLLKEAADKNTCQIIVTTHSPILIDALSDTPDCILVAEKEDDEGETSLERLDPKEMEVWLQNYRLGELWTSGEIGGNIW